MNTITKDGQSSQNQTILCDNTTLSLTVWTGYTLEVILHDCHLKPTFKHDLDVLFVHF